METIFNLFPICNNGIIQHIGYKSYELGGTDEEKFEFLKKQVYEDYKNLNYVSVPSSFKVTKGNEEEVVGLNVESFNTLAHNGTDAIFYEPIFQICNAHDNPLFVITMIIDGEIKIDRTEKYNPIPKTKYTYSLSEKIPTDYFDEYFTEKGFELDRLIDDDLFKAVKILFQNEFYVSSLKLLLSAIDTIAFLEYGDINGNFKKWVDTFCEIEKFKITSDELWEYRNSLLHMTNSTSRKVKKKQIMELAFYVSNQDVEERTSDGIRKFFNLNTLIDVVADGLEKWGHSFNDERDKFELFIDRYDRVISDKRYSKIYYE